MWWRKKEEKLSEAEVIGCLASILSQLPDELKVVSKVDDTILSALERDADSHNHINRMIVDEIKGGGNLDVWISKISSDAQCPNKVIHILSIVDRLVGRNVVSHRTWVGLMEMLGTSCRMYGDVTVEQWTTVYEKHPMLILYRLLELRTNND